MAFVMRAFGIGHRKAPVFGFTPQTSVYGLGLPIVYGTARLSGNLIHMPKQPFTVGNQHRKGGFSSKGAAGGQDYYAPIAIGLCEGPIGGIGRVWRNKDQTQDFASVYQAHGWSLATGTSSQAAWGYLTTNYPSQAVPYQFTAYIRNNGALLPNDSMPQYSWEIEGFHIFGGGIEDASPADSVVDFLTNAQYGANFPSSRIASTTVFADYCAAAGLFASMVVQDEQPARDYLNEWLEIANTAAVWSDGLLKFVPYGDTALSANGHTYTPNTTPLYDLGDNDFLPNSATAQASGDVGDETTNGELDPVLVKRLDPQKAYNRVTVEFEDRAFDYNRVPVPADDQASQLLNGIIPLTLSLHAIKSKSIARQVAQLRLQREQSVRNTYNFKLGWKYSLLEPMDLVTITDSGLGLSLTPVRIIQIEEMANEQGYDVMAEDWPFGTASATLYNSGSASGFTPNTDVDPGNTTAPIIFEGPQALQSSPLEIWIGAAGGSDWGGCDVYISVDNTNFEKVGTVFGPATFGDLTASLPFDAAYPTIDTTHTASIDLTASTGAVSSQTQLQFDNLVSLCYVGGEFIAFRDTALTSAYHYNLTHLYRGLYNSTIPGTHGIGTAFVVCDLNIIRIPWPIGYVGQVLYFKFPAFNKYGAALQDISTVSSVSHTIGQDPIIPGDNPTLIITVTPGVDDYSIEWSGFGDIQVSIDGGAYSSPSPSPITVTRNDPGGASITYNFQSSANNQTISNTVIVPPKQATGTPAITEITTANTDYPGDGGGSVDIGWTTSNMPSAATFNLDYVITAGATAGGTPSGTLTNIGSSPYTFSAIGIGGFGPTPPAGRLVISAIVNGVVVATGVYDGAFAI